MLVKKNPTSRNLERLDGSFPYLVLATWNVSEGPHKGNWYYVYNDKAMSMPYAYPEELFEIVDPTIPSDWGEKTTEKESLKTFNEWLKDEHFYNYLVEGDWKPDKTKWARGIINAKYMEYTRDYALREYGSVENAKRKLVKEKYDQALKDYQEKGYQKPNKPDLSDDAVDGVPLDINKLVRQ